MKRMKTRWSKRVLVLLAAMTAIMSVNLQAFAATPVRLSGSPRDKKVIAIQNHKAKGMLNYITFEQEKGTAEFTKWKDGYGTVVKSKHKQKNRAKQPDADMLGNEAKQNRRQKNAGGILEFRRSQ